jgi:DNA-directed RNA polymerase subunit RPC12/RpoP
MQTAPAIGDIPFNEIGSWKCPNCGGNDFAEIASNKYRCAYCGSMLRVREVKPASVDCPHCGFKNEREARYCNQCGQTLVSWRLYPGRRDPAITSILVTVIGAFVVPLISTFAGLYLGYKALAEARANWDSNAEKTAKLAVMIGWLFIGFSVLPVCLAFGGTGAQAMCVFMNEMLQNLSNWLRQIGG